MFLFILSCNNILPQSSWERITSPMMNNLNSVYFVDSLYGWAVGDSGTIIHTSDGGYNWEIQNGHTINRITSVFFLNRKYGWAPSLETLNNPPGTYLLKTTDGGENWIYPAEPEENIFSQCVFFLDSLNGWMGGKPSPIVKTTDGGGTWINAEIDSSTFSHFPVFDLKFYNSRIGYASGGRVDICGIIWLTTNGGDKWYAIDTPYIAPEPIYKLYIKDSLNVLGVGGDFEPLGFGVGMMQTSDSGITWLFNYIGISGVGWDIDFRTENEAWSPLGGEKKMIYSLDSGLSWTSINTPDSTFIFSLMFPDSTHGVGVGMNGAIIKYKPEPANLIGQEDIIPAEFVLHQNYPNPFNPTTRIVYYISDYSFVKLSVYNLLGQEVTRLVNEYQSAGNHEITFDGKQLAAGVYIYTLYASDHLSSKKMLLLR